jgi:CheY-like chemotaxis protein
MKKSEVAMPASAFRILLIDDNRNGLVVRKSILEEHGFTVTASSSAEDGISAFQSSEFDLVITDYRMPELSGAEVLRIVRDEKPAIPVIIISGMVDALGLNEKNTGADCVIPKSATEASHLVRAVNRLLRSNTPRKPNSLQTARRALKRAVQ